MLTLASPALALRLGNSDAGNNPPNQTTRQAYDLLARGFGPGFNGPMQLVANLLWRTTGGADDVANRRAAGDSLPCRPFFSPRA